MRKPKVLRHATNYAEHRVEEYALPSDQLDAIAKGFRAIIDGKPLPAETVAWVEACEAVKAKFPKRPKPKS